MQRVTAFGSVLRSFWPSTAACGMLPSAETDGAARRFDERTVADFYRGKTVRIVVGFSAAGGYDQYSRLVAEFLGMSPDLRGRP
ncbi:MAG TPA: hypothetical protein VNN77_12685 [candidate division Zixibacteria bacterium]|nr:hypothetical protein [candidate division Zixibacteria bacterium]